MPRPSRRDAHGNSPRQWRFRHDARFSAGPGRARPATRDAPRRRCRRPSDDAWLHARRRRIRHRPGRAHGGDTGQPSGAATQRSRALRRDCQRAGSPDSRFRSAKRAEHPRAPCGDAPDHAGDRHSATCRDLGRPAGRAAVRRACDPPPRSWPASRLVPRAHAGPSHGDRPSRAVNDGPCTAGEPGCGGIYPAMNIFARILAGYALTLLMTLSIAAVAVVQVGQMETASNRGAGANAQLIVGLIVVLAIVITVGIGVFIARSISVPLGQITVAANRIGVGELIETPSFARQDEIGVLAGALTRMMQGQRNLAERERTAKEEWGKTITRYIAFVARVADRDLSGTLEVSGNGEIAALGRDLNKMNANLRELAVQIQDATNDLGSGVSEILAAASEQTSSAANQATAIQETTATINAIRTTVEQTSQRSGQVASMARDSVKATDDGRGSVESTIESMAAIKAQVEGIAQNILALSGQGQQIGDIITTVNDFAEQSNLLALNAAIEAARAGEHGKGFAVVASEVRNLAEQSKVATTRVRELLSEIQKATNSAVMVTEEGLKGVESGSKNVDGAGTAIKSLSETIRRTAQTAEQIAIAVQQQTVGMEQIAVAMGEINQATAQAVAGSRQTQLSAQNITELSERMSKLARSYILS